MQPAFAAATAASAPGTGTTVAHESRKGQMGFIMTDELWLDDAVPIWTKLTPN